MGESNKSFFSLPSPAPELILRRPTRGGGLPLPHGDNSMPPRVSRPPSAWGYISFGVFADQVMPSLCHHAFRYVGLF